MNLAKMTKSTEYDRYKLKRVLTWLKSTINDKSIMGMVSNDILHTWIDVSYAVHDNMRGQSGEAISMGHGIVTEKLVKQKLNSKSSTETEVIGMSDILPHNLWHKYFLEHQGYVLQDNILYQDNQSAINLEKKWEEIVHR